ncbi:MAG: PspC domain-containing protein [Bacillota bacterium]
MTEKLYRSRKEKMIAGVCGGIGVKTNIDPTIMRLIWVVASLLLAAGIGGLFIYILFAIIIPLEPEDIDV